MIFLACKYHCSSHIYFKADHNQMGAGLRSTKIVFTNKRLNEMYDHNLLHSLRKP